MFGALVMAALAQCPGGQCYAPAVSVPVPVTVPAVAYYRTPTAYYWTAPRYYRTAPVRGWAYYCTPSGCYRR